MKKVVFFIAILATVFFASAQEESWDFSMQFAEAPAWSGSTPPEELSWYATLIDKSTGIQLDVGTSSIRLVDNSLYIFGWTANLKEETEVFYRVYNNANFANATHFLNSNQSITLPNISSLSSPEASQISLGFSGSETWQAVPEPATIGLFGLGALGAWFVRRNKKLKEEVA